MTDLLQALRSATRPLHDELDGAAASRKIGEGTLTADDYRRLIAWQYRAHAVAEGGLEDFSWPGPYRYRRRGPALLAEARALGLPLPLVRALQPPQTLARATGRAYVLEGSSLGGNKILGHLRRNARLAGLSDFDFYAFQRDEGLGQWRGFTAFAKTRDWTPEEVGEAQVEAVRVFGVFGDGGTMDRSSRDGGTMDDGPLR